MNAFWEVIGKTLKNGFRTSEFVIAALALLLPLLEKFIDPVINRFDPTTLIGGVIAAVYVAVRGWIKAKATGAIIQQAPVERLGDFAPASNQTVPTPQGWSGSSEGIPEYRPGWKPDAAPIPGVDTPHRPNDPKEL